MHTHENRGFSLNTSDISWLLFSLSNSLIKHTPPPFTSLSLWPLLNFFKRSFFWQLFLTLTSTSCDTLRHCLHVLPRHSSAGIQLGRVIRAVRLERPPTHRRKIQISSRKAEEISSRPAANCLPTSFHKHSRWAIPRIFSEMHFMS